jgi:hypothetical protein
VTVTLNHQHGTEQRHEEQLPDGSHLDTVAADGPAPARPAQREPPVSRRGFDPLTAWAWFAALLCAAAMVWIAVWATSPPADAHQPYGGCAEGWMYPRSEGAWHCRSHGWTIRQRFVIGPNGHVKFMDPYRLQPCPTEDSGWCFWNHKAMGNHRGKSFIINGQRDGKHRVWEVQF